MRLQGKQNKRRVAILGIRLALTASLLFVGLTGCLPVNIKTQMLVPAKSAAVSQLRKTAVLPFTGSQGDQVSMEVEALLVNIQVQGKPYFTVIERARLRKVMKEHYLQHTGAIDEKTAVTLGKLIGADGIIMGAVTNNSVTDSRFREEIRKCTRTDKDGDCTNWTNRTIGCTKRDASFSMIFKVINVQTGQIVTAETFDGKANDNACRDLGQTLNTKCEMLQVAKHRAIKQIRQLVAPYSVSAELPLLRKDNPPLIPAAQARLDGGIKWAKAGRLDRACEQWREADRLNPNSCAISYNLGVCAETEGSLQKAMDYYEKADRLTIEPVKEICKALDRTRERLGQQKQLRKQL